VLRHPSIERPGFVDVQERGQGPGGDAFPPELFPDPVAHLPHAEPFEAHDIAGHVPVEQDGLGDDAVVLKDPRPVLHEGVPVPGGEGRHLGRGWVQLLLEQDGEVSFRHISQVDAAAHGTPQRTLRALSFMGRRSRIERPETGGELMGVRPLTAGIAVTLMALVLGTPGDVLAGQAGCTITGTNQSETLSGTPGGDVICGLGGGDTLRGKRGDDVLRGGRGRDTLHGGHGRDTVLGGPGSDNLDLGRGADVARGGRGSDFSAVASAGPDQWFGGSGPDSLIDFKGFDRINGGAGDASCLSTFDQAGGDTLLGGPGFDIWLADGADDVQGVEKRVQCFAE
jgi:hypothetical protein